MMRNPQRAWKILDAVVRLNVETGGTVSSGLVERYLQREISSATIRNVMKELEEAGFLEQPHTSAGRQPTDSGFRAFVDRLLAHQTLQPWDAPRPLRRAVEEGVQRHAGSHAMIRVLAGLLSELTTGVSIILGPSWSAARAQRLEIYPKENRRLLVVLVLENALVRTAALNLRREYPPDVLDAAARLLSERICGRTVGEIRDQVLASFQPAAGPVDRCACEVAQDGRTLFAEFETGELELEGVGRVLEEPEFGEPGTLKTLIRFIESPRSIRGALHRLDRASEGGLGIWIGRENPVGELRSFAVVMHRFPLEGREGIMAVLGPRRMAYHRALTGIDMLRDSLRSLS